MVVEHGTDTTTSDPKQEAVPPAMDIASPFSPKVTEQSPSASTSDTDTEAAPPTIEDPAVAGLKMDMKFALRSINHATRNHDNLVARVKTLEDALDKLKGQIDGSSST